MSVDAILTGDWHLREDQPECRTDNYWEAQAIAVDFVRELQDHYDCPVLLPGDVFHKWKSSPFLEAWALEHLPRNVIAIPGQHDLPGHSLEKLPKSSLYVLHAAGRVDLLTGYRKVRVGDPQTPSKGLLVYGYPFGTELEPPGRKSSCPRVALAHVLTYLDKAPFPGCTTDRASKLLKRLSGFGLVVTGDNHESFVLEKGDRLLVNPGSLLRMTAAQMKHKPRVYLWDAGKNKVKAEYLPIEKGAVSRQHLDSKEEVDERIQAFVSKLRDDSEIGLSFPDNLKEYMNKNKVPKKVQQLVWEACEQ